MKSMRPYLSLALVAVLAVLGACRTRAPAAYGEANSVIIAAPDSLWTEVEDTMRSALEPRIFTVRDERAYQITHARPTSAEWSDLRKFKQVMLIGRPDDPWMAEALDDEPLPADALPMIVERQSVWANGQYVTAIVLGPEDTGRDVAALLPAVSRVVDTRFRSYVRQRMFASGQNTELRDSLRATVGFGLTVPNVYQRRSSDSTYLFQNAYPQPSELMRSVLVSWRSGADALSQSDLLAWRDSVSRAEYALHDQRTERERIEARAMDTAGADGLEVQGIWSTPPGEWPAAGPFVSRAVPCPDQGRTYLMDAWLYAPGKDKYEYMLQLETILDSFDCGAGTPPASAAGGSTAGAATTRPADRS